MTVGELNDRRARKKAQTRELIRDVAHRLFADNGFEAVTIVDIAAEADVAVQTVFNHFATKEELFFDGRTPWLDAPAAAVRDRDPSVGPLTALRTHLVAAVHELIAAHACPQRRRFIETLESSDDLRAHEREILHESEMRLRVALQEAWSADAARGELAPTDSRTVATLTAALWLAAVRSLVADQRPDLAEGADPRDRAAEAGDLADRVLRHLEQSATLTYGKAAAEQPSATGWPRPVLQAG
jgi:AcrR family transcriptional regulator